MSSLTTAPQRRIGNRLLETSPKLHVITSWPAADRSYHYASERSACRTSNRKRTYHDYLRYHVKVSGVAQLKLIAAQDIGFPLYFVAYLVFGPITGHCSPDLTGNNIVYKAGRQEIIS